MQKNLHHARATERRYRTRIDNAIAAVVDADTVRALREERETDPYGDCGRQDESVLEKLHRLKRTSYGQAWLKDHPSASWDDIRNVAL